MNRTPLSCGQWMLLLAAVFQPPGRAGVAPDGSFGASGALPGPNFAIPASLGKKVGGSLFHSFSEFSLDQTQSATFSGPADVANIFSRVTGGTKSTIDGALTSTISGANFFLLNPQGVIFGPNATVDVSGSFAVVAGDRIALTDGTRFRAEPGPSDALLTSAPAAAFGFLVGTPAPITIEGSQLSGADGARWSLVGGRVKLKDATLDTGGVVIRAGRFTMNNSSVSIAAQDASNRADLRATQALALKNGSRLQSVVTDAAGGGLRLEAPQVTVRGAGSTIRTATSGTAPSGRVKIVAGRELVIRDGAVVETQTDGAGAGGDIRIRAGEVTLIGRQPFDTGINADSVGTKVGSGPAGNIRLDIAGRLMIRAGDQPGSDPGGDALGTVKISSDTIGPGRGGNIAIAAQSVRLDGRSINTFVGLSAESQNPLFGGAGGNLRLDLRGPLELTGGGQITAQTNGPGLGGNIDIHAERLLIAGQGAPQSTAINARTIGKTAGGRGGDIRLDLAGDATLLSGGTIFAGSTGTGEGGSIEISARALTLEGDGTRISATTELPVGGGAGGDIRVHADSITGRTGSTISASTTGSGRGGTITLEAARLALDGAQITADTAAPATTQLPLLSTDLRVSFDLVQPGSPQPVSVFIFSDNGFADLTSQVGIVEGSKSFTFALPAFEGSPFNGQWNLIFGYFPDTTIDPKNPLRLDRWSLTTATPGGKVTLPGSIPVGPDGLPSIVATGTELTVRALDVPLSLPGPGGSINNFSRLIVDDSLSRTVPVSPGVGGGLLLKAGTLTLEHSAEISARTFDAARGGNVQVVANDLSLSTGGTISAGTAGAGRGGKVRVQADAVTISAGDRELPTVIGAESSGGSGRGGDVFLSARSLEIKGRADVRVGVSATSLGAGSSGSVRLDLGTLEMSEHGFIGSSNTGTGDAGSIVIRAGGDVALRGGSLISTSARVADAGEIQLTSDTRLSLREDSSITASAGRNGGSIRLAAPDFIYLRDSALTATAGTATIAGSAQTEGGAGGNIFIDPEFIVLDHSLISANAAIGRGGNILLRADNFLFSESAITATGSTAGTVEIVAPELDLSAALVILPGALVDASTQLRELCAARLGLDFSSFLVIGRGGVSLSPDEPLPSGNATLDREKRRALSR